MAKWDVRWRRALESARAPYLIAALGMLLTTGALGKGLVFDDYFHRMVVQEGSNYLDEKRHALDQFAFLAGDQPRREYALSIGVWPWWGSAVKIMFFRPVAALTHWLDYAIWPNATWVAHLMSSLWYGVLVVAVAALYRRTLTPGWTAALATWS